MKNTTFLVSNKCNLECNHCFSCSGKAKGLKNELSLDQQKESIDKLKNIGTERIVFSGGEPMLYPDIMDIIKYASQQLKTSILTNGTLLNKEKINDLKLSGISDLALSIYTQEVLGFSDRAYSKYLEHIYGTIQSLQENNITYKITIPINSQNTQDTISFLKKLEEINAKPIKVRLFVISNVGRAKEKSQDYLIQDQHTWNSIISQLNKGKDGFKSLKVIYELNYSNDESYFQGCQLNMFKENVDNNYGDPHMDANGDLYLCGLLLRDEQHKIGNIFTDSIEDITTSIKNYSKNLSSIQGIKHDICLALNRQRSEKEKLVCPIIYNQNVL